MNPDAPPSSAAAPDPAAWAPPGVPALEVALGTDPGREPSKQVNEDSAFARMTAHGHLAVVCDGMGGHVGGREASSLAIQTIFAVFDATPHGAHPQAVLGDAIRRANTAIWERGLAMPELKGMGSTCVAVLTHAGGSEVAHVGDSRVYLLTQQQIFQVTKDHSLVQRLVDANMLTPEQAANHPNANQITNAFGQKPEIEVEIRPQPFPHGAGDTFLLCSDGLSDECGPSDFLDVLAPFSPCTTATQQLIDLANARGGHDNITVLLVRFPGGVPFTPMASVATPPLGTPAATPAMGSQQATVEMQTLSAPMTSSPPAAIPASTPLAPPVFQPPPAYAPTPIEPQPKKSGKGLVVGIIVVLLLVAGGVTAAVVLRGEHGDDKGQKSSPPPDDEPAPSASQSTSKKPKQPIPKPTASEPDPPPPPSAPSKPPANGLKVPVPSTVKEPTTKEPTTKSSE